MPLTRAEAESYIGKHVVVTWSQTPDEQAYYGCVDGSMETVVWKVDGDWLVGDDGMGVRFASIKSIDVIPELA